MADDRCSLCPWRGNARGLPYILLLGFAFSVSGDSCRLGKFDFSMLRSNHPWLSMSPSNVSFYISLCQEISPSAVAGCPAGTSVCMKHKFESKGISIGNFSKPFNFTNNKLYLKGGVCSSYRPRNVTTVISFKCGHTLGLPEFLDFDDCTIFFEWQSIVVCDFLPKPTKEVPCYTYIDNERRDLSPLIKIKGAYLVDSSSDRKFYINICREITGNTANISTNAGKLHVSQRSTTCPLGSAACRLVNGQPTDMGQPVLGLQQVGSNILQLKYVASNKTDGCTDYPTTTISFMCPTRGGSKDPLLVSDFNCHYVVEWWTEYACPESYISTSACKFTREENDVDIDLSPLTNLKGSPNPYKVTVNESNGDSYTYYLNVCEELGIPCPDQQNTDRIHPSACQVKPTDDNFGKSLGSKEHQTLRYSDGQLTLIYRNGDACHTHFHRTTIINFICNQSAVDGGKGRPVFQANIDCNYYFDWPTKYACLSHPLVQECRTQYSGKRFDLSALVRRKGTNWQALNGNHYDDKADIFVNVCNDVLREGAAAQCPAGSSICLKQTGGIIRSLGKYVNGPVYNPKTTTIQMNYTDGDTCGSGKKTYSVVTFFCKPGDLQSAPELITKSDDDCSYEFVWHTAAACILSHKTGTSCKVYDDDAGYSFELSQLTKPSNGSYQLFDGTYDYYINVCAAVKGTKCDTAKEHQNAGVCQVKRNPPDSMIKNIGQPNGNLSYFDGMINLTYSGGEFYHSSPPVQRKTEIAFLCDYEAGAGVPKFVNEGNYTYTFIWRTKYACPSPPVECVVTDEKSHKQYDLSSLALTHNNWAVDDGAESSKRKKFYINVCRPLNHIPVASGCSSFAASCQTKFVDGKEVIENKNLGQLTSPLKLVGEGQLLLQYTNGEPCQDGLNQTTYTTSIHFQCKKGALSSGPNVPIKVSQCEYSLIWETEAACPQAATVTSQEPCMVKDANSGYVFNLQPLMKKGDEFYSVSVRARNFTINICGKLSEKVCDKIEGKNPAMCEVQPTRKIGLAFVSSKLEYFNGHLHLKYAGKRFLSGQRFSAEIIFICSREQDLGSIKYIEQTNDQRYLFEFRTSLACLPQPVDCTVQDKSGNQYDLSHLAKVHSNWKVVDTRVHHKGIQYIINVCRPLNSMKNETCAGPIGGCQITADRGPFSMGFVQGKPIALSDGTLSIHYRGGTLCHKGTPKESHRSMRINFFCSVVEHDPVFEGETETCEYIFSWRTPVACPINRVIGKDCKVVDPLYNYEFDLGPLQKTTTDYQVHGDGYEFVLNVCKTLNNGHMACSGTKGVAACQTRVKPPLIINLGQKNDKLMYDAGEITLTYSDGKFNCHGKYNRSTVITFSCDHSQNGSSGPRYIQERDDCVYMFLWPTSRACPPVSIGDCSVTNKGNVYDLSTLSQTDNNYQSLSPNYVTKKFIINVCRSLVHQKGQTCPFNAASCIIETNQTDPSKRFHSIGQVGSKPVRIENGQVVLVYENGELCADKKRNSSTHIEFICNKQAIGTSPTGYYTDKDGCEHHFIWSTRAACPKNDTITSAGFCKAINPATGFIFDLTPLKKGGEAGYSVADRLGHQFELNVCAHAKGPCGKSSGSCQAEIGNSKQYFNAGNFNGKLQYDDGVLFLNYTGGAKCQDGKFERNTIINFVCNSNVHLGQPVFVDKTDDCTYYFSWHTSLACEKQIPCSVINGSRVIDLSPLIKPSGHHIASSIQPTTDPGAAFYINICRPLNPIHGELCDAGASACRVKVQEEPQSLGRLHKTPFIDPADKRVTLIYDNGTRCTKDPSKNSSSIIKFTCNPGPSQGQPVLLEVIDSCTYIFNWETNVICPPSLPGKETSCKFFDSQTSTMFDLTPLKNPIKHELPALPSGKYLVSLCQPLSAYTKNRCKTSGICYISDKGEEASFGEAANATFQMEDDLLSLQYSKGTECASSSTNHASGKIIFQCDTSAEYGSPVLLEKTQCDVSFLWKTKVICPPISKDCAIAYKGNTYDFSILSLNTGNWILPDIFGNTYWINICQGLHKRPNSISCPNTAIGCKKSTHGQVTSLGTVASQKIYVNGTNKRGPIIVMEYTHGSKCSSLGQARMIIRFKCAKIVGGPIFHPSLKDNCTFVFIWPTKAACKIQRTSVKDVNGIITDSRTNGTIDFNQFSKGKTIIISEQRRKERFTYKINFDGHMGFNSSKSRVCAGAAICQQKVGDKNYYRNLGDASSRRFYMDGDYLELELMSHTKCTGDPSKNVTTVFDFFCSMLSKQDFPTFTYETKACMYLFTWTSSVACQHINRSAILDTRHTPTVVQAVDKIAIKSRTIGLVIGVFLVFIILSFMLVVFHKPEKRAYIMQKMKNLCSRNSASGPVMTYIKVSQLDDDEKLLGIESHEENTASTAANPFHDDSDEDMLL